MEYLAIPAVLVFGVLLLIARKRAADKRHAPFLRIYETRLLSACKGDKAAMLRLVNEEFKQTPGLPRHEVTKRALDRVKAAQ